MRIRLNTDSFCRTTNGETLFWNRRNTACEIHSGVSAFAAHLDGEWIELNAIYSALADSFGISPTDIANDYDGLISELIHEAFLDCDGTGWGGKRPEVDGVPPERAGDPKTADADWTPLGGFFEKHNIPIEIHIDLTAACTERCVHCYLPDYPNKHLQYTLVEKALREFRAMQGLTVHLTGGECMIHPDFERICMLCQALNLNVVLLSNMTLCDSRRVEFLKEFQPQFINVSLYSMDPEEHESITTLQGSWKKTMDAILACEEAGVHIRLAAPLLKKNKGAFGALKRFAVEHRMNLIPTSNIVPQSNHDCSNMAHACSPVELECLLREQKELFDESWGAPKDLADTRRICDVGVARIYLNSLGNYYPCDGMHGYVLGNVAKESLEAIWKGDKLNRLRALCNADFPQCQKCPHRLFCKVCPAFNYNATGDVLKTIPEKCANAAVVHQVYGET